MPKNGTVFVYHKYIMKHDFKTYILNKLNEDNKENPKTKEKDDGEEIFDSNTGNLKTTDLEEIKEWAMNNKDHLSVKNGLIYYNDPNRKNKKIKVNVTKNAEDLKNYIIELKANKGVVKSYSKDTFEKLGETYAYRSLVCLASLKNANDFKELTNDVFENDPDNVLTQINDLPAYFDFAAACTAVSNKLSKEEDDSDSAKIATQCKALLNKPETRFEGIEKTKKEIKGDFTKYRDIFTNAFDDGLKEQHKKMSEKGFKWVDPATGLPPKGFKGNAAKILGQGIEGIMAIGNKFADKIKSSPHNLENDIARAAIIGVKMIAVGVHGIGKLFGIFGNKKFTYKNITSKSVDKKINEFKPKYEEAKKGNYLPTQIKKETDEEKKKKCEQFKRDFQSLMYDELIPMYYKQTQVFSECYLNLNNKYILLQTNDGWQTKQAEGKNISELWNAVLLLKEHINKCDKFFKSLNLYNEFKDSKMELFLGSVKKNSLNEHQEKIKKWFDKIDEENTDKEKIGSLKNIINIYTANIMMPSMSLNSETFAQYKDKLNKALTDLNAIKEIPLVNELKIKFKDDDDSSEVKGIKSIKQAETENKEELSNEYKEIRNVLKELKNINELEKVNDTFTTINSKVNNTIEQLKGMIEKETDEEKKNKLTKLLLAKTTIDKIIAIKVIMNNFKLTESVAMNEIIKLLNEETEEGTPDIENIKNEINEIIEGDITLDNVSDYIQKSKDVYKKIDGLYNKLNDDTKKNFEKYKDNQFQLLYAISSIKGEQNEEPTDQNDIKKLELGTEKLDKILADEKAFMDEDFSKTYEKIKAEYEDLEKDIKSYCEGNEEKLDVYEHGKQLIAKYKDDILPKLWFAYTFLDNETKPKNENYNPFIDYSLLYLLEAETEGNEGNVDNDKLREYIKSLFGTMKELMTSKEFTSKYDEWKTKVSNLYSKLKEKLEDKNLIDPVQQLSAICVQVKNNTLKTTENPQQAEESDKSGETEKS